MKYSQKCIHFLSILLVLFVIGTAEAMARNKFIRNSGASIVLQFDSYRYYSDMVTGDFYPSKDYPTSWFGYGCTQNNYGVLTSAAIAVKGYYGKYDGSPIVTSEPGEYFIWMGDHYSFALKPVTPNAFYFQPSLPADCEISAGYMINSRGDWGYTALTKFLAIP